MYEKTTTVNMQVWRFYICTKFKSKTVHKGKNCLVKWLLTLNGYNYVNNGPILTILVPIDSNFNHGYRLVSKCFNFMPCGSVFENTHFSSKTAKNLDWTLRRRNSSPERAICPQGARKKSKREFCDFEGWGDLGVVAGFWGSRLWRLVFGEAWRAG